jgi:predicted dehydrogenase
MIYGDALFSRRSLLAGAAAAMAGASVRPLLAQESQIVKMPEPKKLGFAIVGIGTLSKGQILPAFSKCKWARPVAFVTGHPVENRARAEQLGIDAKNIYTYENYDQIKDNPEIDAVYVVLPNSMHAEYTIRAAKAGKHVLCEKPMANTVEECQAMVDACKEANRKLQIAYRLQYEPLTRAAIAIARDPEQIGEVKEISAESGFTMGANATPENTWRLNKKMAGGGPLMDMGIYALQAARYLSGQEPTLVMAISQTPADSPKFSQVEETMTISLQFASGLQASLLTTYGFSCNRARVYGTRGMLELEPLQYYSGNHVYFTCGGRGGGRQEVAYAPVDHFAAEMDAFCEAIAGNKQPATPGEEGLRDMKIMMGAYESARTGQSVKVG